jgi:hypothetical protein
MRKLKKLHSGFFLLEIIIGIGLTIIAGIGCYNYIQYTTDFNTNKIVAEYQKDVQNAANDYINDNYSAVLANSSATSPAVITVSMLKTSNYLPQSFSSINPYQQTYTVYALQPTSNKLQTLLVSSGGTNISDKNLLQITSIAGADAGYISSQAPGTVSSSVWSIPLSNYRLANNAGHLASALFFSDGKLDNDYLYRSAVNGHPEVNQMNTAIDMNNNNINNASTVNTTTLNATTTNATTTNTSGETYTGGWFRTTGTGGLYFSKYGGGWYMNDTATVHAYGDKNVQTAGGLYGGYVNSSGNIDAAGTVSGNSLNGNYVHSNGNSDANGNMTANGRVTSGEFVQINGVAYAGNGCSPNGLVGRDGTGAILSCQSGVWSSGKSNTIVRGASGSITASVACNGNETLFGGGAQCDPGSDTRLKWSVPSGNGWAAACPNATVTVYAICAY